MPYVYQEHRYLKHRQNATDIMETYIYSKCKE